MHIGYVNFQDQIELTSAWLQARRETYRLLRACCGLWPAPFYWTPCNYLTAQKGKIYFSHTETAQWLTLEQRNRLASLSIVTATQRAPPPSPGSKFGALWPWGGVSFFLKWPPKTEICCSNFPTLKDRGLVTECVDIPHPVSLCEKIIIFFWY